jgi:hypothetical protein
MKGKNVIPKVALLFLAFGLVGLVLGLGVDSIRAQSRDIGAALEADTLDKTQASKLESEREFPVPLTPLPKTITPCRACHGPEKDFPVNYRRREDLLVHKNVKLNHGGVRVWCLDCHNSEDRNYLLPLSDGKPIDFEHSYLLCGKCHGTKFRDWRNGIHGRRTGNWNGEKTYYRCVTCHDPHSPKFKPIEPMPPPRKPWAPKETKAKH